MNVLGLDIGGTKCAVSACRILSNNIEICEKTVFTTNTDLPCREMLSEYYPTMARYIEKYNCESIGISCGGPLDSKAGRIIAPPNLPNFRDFDIVKTLKSRFKLPTFLQNDANASALAEWLFGAGKGTESMVFLTFGTGLGAGLILNGRLYEGANGNAGEIGHVRLQSDGPIGFKKQGSFEGFCSGGGLAQLGKMYGVKVENGDITAKSIADAAVKGDPTAIEVYKVCGRQLGCGLSILIDVLNPEKIVIGSIFARSKELLWASCLEEMEKESLSVSLEACEVVPAILGEKIGDIAAATVAAYGMRNLV